MKKDKIKFLDYTIIDCHNSDGIVLCKEQYEVDDMYECHLGNYDTAEDAKRAAILFYMIARPRIFATHIFHYLIGTGTWGEEKILIEQIKKDGLSVPEELKITKIFDTNFPINFNGDVLVEREVDTKAFFNPALRTTLNK